MTTFERIKFLADKQKISLQKVSTDVGLSENAIYGWKTRKPKGEDLAKIADYFHVTVDYLLGREGDYKFEADDKGRSSTARAILTYSQYESSKGSRQGQPLEPPFWPKNNPKTAITFSLTGKTYHGYQFNRSHSIADSLLGKDSYTSNFNFTTGTRSQNVGANKKALQMQYLQGFL